MYTKSPTSSARTSVSSLFKHSLKPSPGVGGGGVQAVRKKLVILGDRVFDYCLMAEGPSSR